MKYLVGLLLESEERYIHFTIDYQEEQVLLNTVDVVSHRSNLFREI